MNTEYLNVRSLARMLDVAEQSVYKWAKDGTIPSVKVGRSLRFSRQAIEKWLQNGGAIDDNENWKSLQLFSSIRYIGGHNSKTFWTIIFPLYWEDSTRKPYLLYKDSIRQLVLRGDV